MSRRQHVPNQQCALNNDVHLITWLYGMSSTKKRVTILITDMYHSAFRDGFAWHRRVHSSTSVSTHCSYMTFNHKVLASGEGHAWIQWLKHQFPIILLSWKRKCKYQCDQDVHSITGWERVNNNIPSQVGALPDQFPIAWQVRVLSPTRL